MEMMLNKIVPEGLPYRHSCEGPDDMVSISKPDTAVLLLGPHSLEINYNLLLIRITNRVNLALSVRLFRMPVRIYVEFLEAISAR